jgi:hypothetical protein
VDKVAEIRAEKAASYQGLRELFESLAEADWSVPAQGHAGGWTVRDTLTHLVTAGPGLLRAAQLLAEGRLQMRPDFDLDLWNQRQVDKQSGRTTAELLADLAALHRDTLAYLDTLVGADAKAVLSRRGQHAVFGETTVEHVLRRIYQHEREHAAELRQALAGR